jgi:hypothetical protein
MIITHISDLIPYLTIVAYVVEDYKIELKNFTLFTITRTKKKKKKALLTFSQ